MDAAKQRDGKGIFGRRPKMTPNNVRRWFQLMREELGWSLAEAAARGQVDEADLAAIEATGATDERPRVVRYMAQIYCEAMFGGEFGATEAWMNMEPLARFGDKLELGAFEVATFLRRQREALGLTLDEVVAALTAHDTYTGEQYPFAEWGQPFDVSPGPEFVARVLKFPVVELLRLGGEIDTDDLDEWFAWRAAQQQPAKRKKRPRRDGR